ncbi:AAA family ATPase [Bordetella sp. LUAb4]|uniref:AAA family ATPase n=1 Tax=Bordetella sp. LUAb4 TaxID=2843195 RepID=UPI001E63528D|nr:AAA family ATPase [Bordetella sp. LUAb4]
MYLVDLELENFRAIRHMTLQFGGKNSAAASRRWTVLLGENGCGKSSVLKAIGLLLAGSEALPDLLGTTDQWIHTEADTARLRATIATADGKEREVSLVLRRGKGRDSVIKSNAKQLRPLDAAIGKAERNYFLAGYGAFRRPPGPSQSRRFSSLGRAGHVATLFSHDADLVSLEDWAMDLDYRREDNGRAIISSALNRLLPGMSFKSIDKERRAVIMSTIDGDVPLRQLSEGYQAMAAWAGDLLFRMTETFGDYRDPLAARGLLLIDEMDLHLHPVWKRTLVEFLNDAFPNLQVVATTHSPLSVQQCNEDELFVIRREAGQPTLIPFKGDPSRMRLSELFLSPLIGLDTLDSPKVAALRAQARGIELKRGQTSAQDLEQLRAIERELEGSMPLSPAEAPAFAARLLPVSEIDSADVATRIRDAEALFGTDRPPAVAPTKAAPSVKKIKTGTAKKQAKKSTKTDKSKLETSTKKADHSGKAGKKTSK